MTLPAIPTTEQPLIRPKVIVLDDDPTGSQTVHSCLLLMRWDVETLRLGLQDDSPIFFILTNTRSRPPAEAEHVIREVCRNLKAAIALEQIQHFLIVSRSDSTLRGHYPLETDAIANELGPFDAHFLVPAFFEGGRLTRNSIHHYVYTNGSDGTQEIPVHETEFARDPVFGFSHSYLPNYVEEKTGGAIAASAVKTFQLSAIRSGCLDQLLALEQNQCVVVDGEQQTDLDQLATDLFTAASRGKRFLFRSAASLLTSLAQLPPQPISMENMGQLTQNRQPGAVIVGSYTSKTTEQLEILLQRPDIAGIEINLSPLLGQSVSDLKTVVNQLLHNTLKRVNDAHHDGYGVVIYTSREVIQFDHTEQQLHFSHTVVTLLNDIVQQLPPTTGFLISKGGMTSNTILSDALALRSARLLGQIVPGCCIVCTDTTHPQFPNLPVVMFPGNVGDTESLAIAYTRLASAP
ncbi:MAG: four-carbon acid sugar kinase family protein [Merismopedia sp. SIO2A8]|nr:four-carbon acid sugar kinase family protein [Merismopedia sp. SIO2A8]